MSGTSEPTGTPKATMVVIGGLFNRSSSSSVDVYLINNGTVKWIRKGADAPAGWYEAGIAAVGSVVYIAGGTSYGHGLRVVRIYDTAHDRWSELPKMMYVRSSRPALFVLNGALYVAGGTPSSLSVEYMDIKAPGAQWRESSVRLPHHRWQSVAVVVKGDVYISGQTAILREGGATSSPSPTFLRWSVGDPSWTSLANMTRAKAIPCMVTDEENYIWVVGRGLIEQYDISLGTWSTATTVSRGMRLNHYICVYWDGYHCVNE